MEDVEASTFRMSRESETASRLKVLISDLFFFDDYSDDVLAEYITILVCNGRSQFQAREDLKAFFGERSEEFVTWLWELLQKEFSQYEQDDSAFDPRISGEFSACGFVVCKGSESGSKDYKRSNFDPIQGLKVEKTSLPSFSSLATASTENVVSHKSAEVNYMNVLWKKCNTNDLGIAKVINKDNRNSSALNYTGKISSIAVPAFLQQDSRHSYILDKTVSESIIHHHDLHLPNRESDLRARQSAPSGRVVLAGSYDAPFHQKKKPQVFEKEVLHWHEPAFSAPNSEHIRRLHGEVPTGCNRHESFRSHTNRQVETRTIVCSKPHVAANLTRKRPSGEMSANAEDVSVGKGGSNLLQHKEPSQDVIPPNLLPKKSAKLDLASEVLKMKRKLARIKMQMFKLQSKQSKKQKVGEPKIPSQSGELPCQVKSRIIFITNVHYAARKGAISMFFSKCGAVEDVEMLNDLETGNPIGAALVKFASKESVDKAIAMSGTALYSRSAKIVRMTEIDASATLTAAQTNGTGFSGEHHYWRPNLKWRHDSTTSTPIPAQAGAPTQAATPNHPPPNKAAL